MESLDKIYNQVHCVHHTFSGKFMIDETTNFDYNITYKSPLSYQIFNFSLQDITILEIIFTVLNSRMITKTFFQENYIFELK